MSEPNDSNVQVIENATRDDVRPGDHVVWEHTKQRGDLTRTTRHEGIAHRRDASGNWCTKDGQWITIGYGEGVTITIRRTVQDLPTKVGAVIVANDGHEHIEAEVSRVIWRTKEAALGADGQWHGVWRTVSGLGVIGFAVPEDIIPGTWKVDGQ